MRLVKKLNGKHPCGLLGAWLSGDYVVTGIKYPKYITPPINPNSYGIWGKWTGSRYSFEENPIGIKQEDLGILLSDPVEGIREVRDTDDLDALLFQDNIRIRNKTIHKENKI